MLILVGVGKSYIFQRWSMFHAVLQEVSGLFLKVLILSAPRQFLL